MIGENAQQMVLEGALDVKGTVENGGYKKEELPDNSQRRIFVFERASQFELLSRNPDTFMWVSPIPQELLDRYGLIQRVCPENTRKYKDVLVHRKDYELTELDNIFIEQLVKAKRKTFG